MALVPVVVIQLDYFFLCSEISQFLCINSITGFYLLLSIHSSQILTKYIATTQEPHQNSLFIHLRLEKIMINSCNVIFQGFKILNSISFQNKYFSLNQFKKMINDEIICMY